MGENGGYTINNGASVCEEHHLACEMTIISVEDVRRACGISKMIIPSHLYDDEIYDKWGNIILTNGQRLRGELFFDESVQKILSEFLYLFTNRVKYCRTNHVPWSDGINEDERIHINMKQFIGGRVIVTEKMDGENTTMYSDYIHARSIDGKSHSSRNWVKNFWSTICADIPEDWRICGENVFAKHSIYYEALSSYFFGFSIWNERNVCLSWGDTIDWFAILGIKSVPVLYGMYDEKVIRSLYSAKDWNICEGYVIRIADVFLMVSLKISLGNMLGKIT